MECVQGDGELWPEQGWVSGPSAGDGDGLLRLKRITLELGLCKRF